MDLRYDCYKLDDSEYKAVDLKEHKLLSFIDIIDRLNDYEDELEKAKADNNKLNLVMHVDGSDPDRDWWLTFDQSQKYTNRALINELYRIKDLMNINSVAALSYIDSKIEKLEADIDE